MPSINNTVIIRILLTLLLISSNIKGQNKAQNFTSIDGLSHNTVYEILQDKHGFIWMGTESGLSNFDGQNFNTAQGSYRDQLPSHFVNTLEIDKNETIWVGTTKGLRRINQEKEIIENPVRELANKNISDIAVLPNNNLIVTVNGFGLYIINNNNEVIEHWYKDSKTLPLSSNLIETILIDKKTGLLWVGTKDAGIDLINLSNKYVTTFPIGRGINQIPSKVIHSFTQDHDGNIWIGTKKGISKYDSKNKTIYSVHQRAFSNTPIIALHTDSENNIWVGTELNGLWKITPSKNQYLERIDISDRSTTIRCIFEDAQQNLWIGSQRNGIYVLKDQFHTFKLLGKTELQSNIIWGIIVDDNQTIWAGTDGEGITTYNTKYKTSHRYIHIPNDTTSLSDNNIISAFKDSKDRFWFGTYNGGVNLYLPRIDGFQRIGMDQGLLVQDIRSFGEDKNGTIWFGTNRGGLHYYDEDLQKAVSIDRTRTMDIRSICSKGNKLWLGTFDDGGLFNYNIDSKVLQPIKLPVNIEIIFDLLFDQEKDILWIGTYDKGLLAYHYQEKRLEEFKDHKELTSNIIHAIQQDQNGKLWLSSNHGIIEFDYPLKIVNKHSIDVGIQSSDFMDGSKAMTKRGDIYFGGAGGLNYFTPSEIIPQTYSPNIVLTELKVLNEKIIPHQENQILTNSITDTDEIILSYSQNQFSVKYQGIDYKHPETLMYKYYLHGWDKEWNNVGKNNVASFSNLAPGSYTLLIATKVAGGPWSTPYSLSIQIEPPIWRTWWAKFIYVLVFILMIYYWKKFIDNRAKINSQLELQAQQNKLQQENMQVYKDIIHELNTPINQLLMPLENMILDKRNTNSKLKKQLQMLFFNASKMHNILRFILTNKTQDEGELQLEVYQYNLNTFLLNFKESFQLQAQQQSIQIEVKLPEEDVSGWFDLEKIETVLHFLFLSVLQNSSSSDHIMIMLDTEFKELQELCHIDIHLLNTNMHQKHIDLTKRKTSLVGIPMSELYLKKHKGSIQLPQTGNDFIRISFPINKESYSTSEIKMDVEESSALFVNSEIYESTSEQVIKVDQHIAILDDNKDAVTFLSNILSEYHLHTFDNPLDMMGFLSKTPVDIIIIDHTLEGNNGIEVIKKLKKDAKLAIIPTILIASNLTEKTKVSGLKAGADLCISKPFHISILKTHLQNLINSRKYFKNIYRAEVLSESKEVVPLNEDEQLIKKITNLIEEHLADPEFNVQKIQKEMGLSQSSLYKKIKQQTGMSSTEFLRNFRLKYAKKLLEKSNLPISEVMLRVGFLDAKYFRVSFKKKYNVSPSQYRKEYKTQKEENS
ncbi:two-component regulator propeller domain-containing protein [Flammeovirga agarivorans]|uniref:Helix-turn-helix domain-containing protein n=1 Tax=Flammeovirga agarivorans TaxID=2726742 RepID=A0A7X8SHM5_9BACT|nr:two-component regulator propeller domain-containing protein [Flammeovirga agarivorans]NLR90366.1 helix-turn-helix domain-containing protein [Flammeovirga agarivorans]